LAGGVRPRSVGFAYGYSRLIPSGSKSPSKSFRRETLLPISGEAPERVSKVFCRSAEVRSAVRLLTCAALSKSAIQSHARKQVENSFAPAEAHFLREKIEFQNVLSDVVSRAE